MRNGHLLAEDRPNVLMELYALPSLEDVFLKLCVRESSGSDLGVPDGGHGLTGTLTRHLQSGMSSLRLTNTGKKRPKGSLVYPGITAIVDEPSIQPISYSRKEAEHESEFKKIRRRLSMKVRHNEGHEVLCDLRELSFKFYFYILILTYGLAKFSLLSFSLRICFFRKSPNLLALSLTL